jgi:hypothetical protein
VPDNVDADLLPLWGDVGSSIACHPVEHRAIAYGIFYAVRMQIFPILRGLSMVVPAYVRRGPERERNCAHRGSADSRFGAAAGTFFTFEARGDGSLRSQGRLGDSLCRATALAGR